MSKAAAKPEAEGEAPPKKGGKKLLIIILVVVLLLVVAGGAVVVLLLKKNQGEDGATDAHAKEETHLKVDLSHPPTFVTLEPFTVNLAPAEGDHFLQVVMVLKVVDPEVAEQMKGYMPEIRHEVNLVLSSKLPSEISTVDGREELAKEAMERINYVLGFEKPSAEQMKRNPGPWGPVISVLFNSFIVQ
ncbi:flagellar basal body protein FliL [Nitrogeniibacter mangrovi]|uniref:Flagellar protein FliL n=1 Tax=Nitrogeniibacter mangrovi TaxID=2016596 RepID=A0A6C1B317_9RHOO|nr:flagellar basal body-associated FliL family protein [Nitrogeniibacter mangrovi]QID17255.1 flagellar basal body protein FliL [Nitrogeniibacter mangrovi]